MKKALLFISALLTAALPSFTRAAGNDAPVFLNSGKVLPANLPFSEAVRVGDTLYLSGQIGVIPGSLKLIPGGTREEAEQAMQNIKTTLAAHGRSMADIIKCTVMLADMTEWPAFNEVYQRFFKAPYPARSAFGANGLALGARVEVECIATAGSASAAKSLAGLSPGQKLARLAGRPTGKVIYRGLTLISGTANAGEKPAHADMSIVVYGEKIAAILPTIQLDAALTTGAEIVDARGLFAIPGLIDSHVHYATLPDRAYAEGALKRDIYGGLTGVRDMAGDARALADLSRAALVNEIAAPDIFFSALVAGPGFFEDPRTVSSSLGMTPGKVPWLYAVTDKSDLSRVVAQARGTGATGLKIYADLPGPIVRGLIAEARRQGFPVWTHQQVYPATPYDSLGAATVSHVCMIARYIREPGKTQYKRSAHPSYAGMTADDPGIRKYIAALVPSGTMMDATLGLYVLPPSPDSAPVVPKQCPIELVGDITHAMHKAGVKIIAGTDADAGPDNPFPALYGELEALVRYAGMSPYEVIIAATRNASAAIGKEKEIGTIEPGKYASFVLLKEDPSVDIAKLRSVFMTVKRGTRFLRSDYRHQIIVEPPDL